MTDLPSPTLERATKPSWKRRLLAGYLDYLLFGAPWALVVWSLDEALPVLRSYSTPIGLVFFIALESLLLRLTSWSPGHWLLGIHRLVVSDPFAGSGTRSALVVDPWLKSNETWWTMLFGVIAILDGSKSLARWTLWTPPIPFLGYQLDAGTSAVVLVVLGAWEWTVGWSALRLRRLLLPLGLAYYGLILGSTLLSWRLWPAWIELNFLARRADQGLPVRDGEIELLQRLLPGAMVAGALLLTLWMLMVAWRIRRASSARTR